MVFSCIVFFPSEEFDGQAVAKGVWDWSDFTGESFLWAEETERSGVSFGI